MSELIENVKKEIYQKLNPFEKQKILMIIELVIKESSGTLMPENNELVEKCSNILFGSYSNPEESNPFVFFFGSENIYGVSVVSCGCSEMDPSTCMETLSKEMINAKDQIMIILMNLRDGNLVNKILSEIFQENNGLNKS